MERPGKLKRRRVRSQRHFKPSFLQSTGLLPRTSTPPTPTKVPLKKPLEVPSQNLVPWMEIFCAGNREVLLHQALMSVKHRHAPPQTTKDPGRLLSRGKTPATTTRTRTSTGFRKLQTAGSCLGSREQLRTASRPSLSNYSTPIHRDNLWSRQSPKFLVSGLSPRSTRKAPEAHFEDDSASVSILETTPKSRVNTGKTERKRQEQFKMTYFNAEVIPEKTGKRMTVMDIRKYIDYLDSQPFK